MLKYLNTQKGIAIYLALIVMFILLSIGLGLSTLLVGQIRIIRGMGLSVVAIYAADTGIERELKEKNPTGTTYSGYLDLNNNGIQDADDSTYTVKVLDPGADGCPSTRVSQCIQSLGAYKGVRRAIEISIPVIPCTSPAQYTVFIGSALYTGSQIGPTGADADALCQGLADAAGIGGGDKKYTAWISDGTNDEPRDRGLKACEKAGSSSASWSLPDGITRVADNWNDLTDGNIVNPINLDENGVSLSEEVWTGTDEFGAADVRNCDSWTSSAGTGLIGDTRFTDARWTSILGLSCSAPRGIYCFQHSE